MKYLLLIQRPHLKDSVGKSNEGQGQGEEPKDAQAKGQDKEGKDVFDQLVRSLGCAKLADAEWTGLQPSEGGVRTPASGQPWGGECTPGPGTWKPAWHRDLCLRTTMYERLAYFNLWVKHLVRVQILNYLSLQSRTAPASQTQSQQIKITGHFYVESLCG